MKAVILLIAMTLAQDAIDENDETVIQVSEPVPCLSLPNSEVARVNFEPNYKLTLRPGDSCFFDSTATC